MQCVSKLHGVRISRAIVHEEQAMPPSPSRLHTLSKLSGIGEEALP